MQFSHSLYCVILDMFIFFTNNVVRIGAYFVYSYWYLKKMLLVLSLIRALKQQFTEYINEKM